MQMNLLHESAHALDDVSLLGSFDRRATYLRFRFLLDKLFRERISDVTQRQIRFIYANEGWQRRTEIH
jgi:hypothetical protein